MAWLNREKAADYAGVPLRTFDTWWKSGLRSYKVGRRRLYDPADIDAYILENSVDDSTSKILEDIVKNFKM